MLRVKQEPLRLLALVGENSAQVVWQKVIAVPDVGFDVSRGVLLEARPKIEKILVEEERVTVEGIVELEWLYESESLDGSSYRKVTLPGLSFRNSLDVLGVDKTMIGQAQVQVLEVDWRFHEEERSLDIEILSLIETQVFSEGTYHVVTHAQVRAPQKVELDTTVLAQKKEVATLTIEESIKESIEIPSGYPSIHQVVDLKIKPELSSMQVAEGMLKLIGYCSVGLLYLDDAGSVHGVQLEKRIPFHLELSHPKVELGAQIKEELTCKAEYDLEAQGKALLLRVQLGGTITVHVLQQTKVLRKIHCPSGQEIATRTEKIAYSNFVNEKTGIANASGVIELEDSHPPIREILATEGKVLLHEIRVEEDKVFLEGVIDVALTYLAHTEGSVKPLYHGVFKNAIPLQTAVSLGGTLPGMHATFHVQVKEIHPDLINRETVEVAVTLKTHGEVSQNMEEDIVVEALEVPPLEDYPPSITYVILQAQDTLWKLAKAYHTTEEAIVTANTWLEEEGELVPSRKLCIPRSFASQTKSL